MTSALRAIQKFRNDVVELEALIGEIAARFADAGVGAPGVE